MVRYRYKTTWPPLAHYILAKLAEQVELSIQV